jgi:hypothetical protein
LDLLYFRFVFVFGFGFVTILDFGFKTYTKTGPKVAKTGSKPKSKSGYTTADYLLNNC